MRVTYMEGASGKDRSPDERWTTPLEVGQPKSVLDVEYAS